MSDGNELPPVKTLRGAELHLLKLFSEILHHHGIKTTRRMFENYVRVPSNLDLEDYGRMKLLERLESMPPRPNIKKLVRELMAENEALPTPDRRQMTADNLDKQIRRLKRDRNKVKAKFATTSPPLRADEPAKFVLVERESGTFRKRKLS